ncbi:transforming growth factor-beta-induced protein ig-h3-like [Ischnura elegans]|uniref:transforming growth factor-beta-induced protein ig-h3-like n=1 Tax=Ischnura elegans TaxID=197161 RepID=UPI001ED8857A|nr:transforming growth factor-beta-induced protein ig-h3-like [Ischnura elegans]XP_046401996.1 transforming growth factor-beta-induced protein ig-h3-like [Ischnura elegans]XP_046401997.1 transforming growth factor-beta-induced protein ig-h3-like [Ischnura elegans]XP_046401998.1 transforming growth factor-beta-induced protein ig-h3-like [Ischnura elegans]
MTTRFTLAGVLIPLIIFGLLATEVQAAVRRVPGGPGAGRRRMTTPAPQRPAVGPPEPLPVQPPGATQPIRRRIPILPPAERWDKIAKQQGPHTCPREEIVDDPEIHYHRAWTGGGLCGRRTAVKIDCCFGYARMPGATGCPLAKPLTSMMTTAKLAGAGAFVDLNEITGLKDAISGASYHALTLLAPTDRAMEQVPEDILESFKSKGQQNLTNYREGPPSLLFHMLAGRVDLKSLPSNSLIPSLFADQPIRFNVFPNGLITADCVPIVQGSLESLEGVVHTIQSPLHSLLTKGDQVGGFSQVPSRLSSIVDTVARHPNLRRFSAVLSHAQRTAASPLLSHSQLHVRQGSMPAAIKPITLLAPTNDAFDVLPVEFLQSVLYNQEALTALISNHIIDGVMCSAIIGVGGGAPGPRPGVGPAAGVGPAGRPLRKPQHMLKTVVGNVFHATCEHKASNESDISHSDFSTADAMNATIDHTNETEEKIHHDVKSKHSADKTKGSNVYMIGDAVILKSDIMALDGVIHVIDRVLVPKRARSLSQIATEMGLTILLSLLPNTGLQSALVGRGSLTLFAPSDDAFKALPKDTLDYYYRNPQETRILLLSHMTSGRYLSSNLIDNQIMHSRYPGRDMRVRVYRGTKMVEDGKIIHSDEEGSNGVLHVVDQVLIPAEESIVSYLTNQGNYTHFLEALSKTTPPLIDLIDSSAMEKQNHSEGLKDHHFTVFAVADDDMNWENDYIVSSSEPYSLPDDAKINNIMRNHIIPSVVWTKVVERNGFYPLQTLDNGESEDGPGRSVMLRRVANGETVTAGNAVVIDEDGENGVQQSNIICTNGVVHRVKGLIHTPNPYQSTSG